MSSCAQRLSVFFSLAALCACSGASGNGTSTGTTSSSNGTSGNTGTASSGSSTGSGAGSNGTGSGTTGVAPNWPLMPNHDGGVIAAPNLVFMTYANDPYQATLEQYGVWLADGGYLPLVAGQYGIGNGTVQFVSLTDAPPTTQSLLDDPFPAYLDTHFASDPTMPRYAPNNLYIVVLPADWPDATAICADLAGFHRSYLSATGSSPLYAVIADCNNGPVTAVETDISHEVVEAVTDPFTTSWVFDDASAPWFFLTGELADMCSSNSTVYSQGQFAAQLIWSNDAAADGGVPCQPWPTGSTYLSLIAPQTMASAPIGGQVQIPLTGWASGPAAAFQLLVQEIAFVPVNGGFEPTFETSPTVSSQTLTPGQTITLTLSVPATAVSGQSGALMVYAEDVATGETLGAAMVGVTAQ